MKYATMALMLVSCLMFQGCVHHHGVRVHDSYTPAPVVHHVVTPAPRHEIHHVPQAPKPHVRPVSSHPRPHLSQNVRHGEPHRAKHHVENRPHKPQVAARHSHRDGGGHKQVGQLSHRGR